MKLLVFSVSSPSITPSLKLDDQLCFALYAAARAMTRAYRPLLAPLALTYPQYLVLLALWERNGATVGTLGEWLDLDTGTLTPLLKRMAASGLIRRSRSRTDERAVEIWLTEHGRALRAQAEGVPATIANSVGLPVDDALALRQGLRELTRKLNASNRIDATYPL